MFGFKNWQALIYSGCCYGSELIKKVRLDSLSGGKIMWVVMGLKTVGGNSKHFCKKIRNQKVILRLNDSVGNVWNVSNLTSDIQTLTIWIVKGFPQKKNSEGYNLNIMHPWVFWTLFFLLFLYINPCLFICRFDASNIHENYSKDIESMVLKYTDYPSPTQNYLSNPKMQTQ